MATEHLFLGAVLPDDRGNGFAQLLHTDGVLYIIKGSAGSGKSTLLRRLLASFEDCGRGAIAVHCAGDPDSLDAVVCPATGIAAVDGTAPHVLEPLYPGGAHRVLSLYRYLDCARLECQQHKLRQLEHAAALHRDSAKRFIAAAGKLSEEILRAGERALAAEKAAAFFGRLARRCIPRASGHGHELNVFYSAVSVGGIKSWFSQNAPHYSQVFILGDSLLAAGNAGLLQLREWALGCGYDVITGRSPLLPEKLLDFVVVPQLSLCFAHNTFINHCACDSAKYISCSRFYDSARTGSTRVRSVFAKKLVGELVSEAGESLLDAKLVHDDIEKIYTPCVDFAAQTAAAETLLPLK